MALKTAWLGKLSMLALLTGIVMLTVSGGRLYRTHDYNQAVADGDWLRAAVYPSSHGELAAAYSLALNRTEDNFQAIVHEFARVIASADSEVKSLARYNLATLYLERGLQLLANDQNDTALPLLELAKEMYRERLRADPAHWDSKYNLEQALRAAPDKAEANPPDELRNPGPSRQAVGASRSKQPLP